MITDEFKRFIVLRKTRESNVIHIIWGLDHADIR